MHAQEQENRIAAIHQRLEAMKGRTSGAMEGIEESINAQGADQDAESSDEDSEEE